MSINSSYYELKKLCGAAPLRVIKIDRILVQVGYYINFIFIDKQGQGLKNYHVFEYLRYLEPVLPRVQMIFGYGFRAATLLGSIG